MSPESQEFLATFVSESYYYWASVIMLLIHVGFLAYEGGAARSKNVLATMVKNLMTLSLVGLTFFFFGWWVYNAFPLFPLQGGVVGPWTAADADGVVGEVLGLVQASYPWSPALGPNIADNLTGVFWFAFALFAMTTASILSGAVIERIKIGAYSVLAIVLGSFTWVVAAAWGWNPYGWFFTQMGYHDFGCSAVLHATAGFFALGVLLNLGPRIGKFDAQGKPRVIMPHNLPLTMVGLMLIFVGFYAFLAACVIFVPGQTGAITIYGTPMTLSSIGVNTTLALSAGLVGAYMGSKADPFYTISGGLAGIISSAAAMDIYSPAIVIILAFVGAYTMPFVGNAVEKAGIDDAVGAFAVHGYCGVFGAVMVGIFAAGYPQPADIPSINLWAQLVGAFICAVLLGFVPGYGVSFLLKKMGLLRVSEAEEIVGLDLADFGIEGYPEYSILSEQSSHNTPGSVSVPQGTSHS
ncbi:ammonium transporter [Nodosilinea sp. LEGE 07088]|uniref:ammonium transporter n=1 Tax=Nodosilinea sp. LEGE 07088 TaxID=2777968 RepID=UPI00187E7303|nr:ammonium transporter [Nodosilinea sp. LEGE 07088]MBE9140804.1 ammonium transporter [Nodosilinea sp. LEGE 07088]